MLKKRLIGVITVKNGWAVQSMGYRRYLPLGKPACLAENLDRWGADEILVQVIDRAEKGPDFELLSTLARLGLGTPLIYGGGVHTIQDGVRTIQAGADRLVVDSILHDDATVVRGLAENLGAQAIIAAMPVSKDSGAIQWLDYRSKNHSGPISLEIINLFEARYVSEVLLIDWIHDGCRNSFDLNLITEFPLKSIPLIVFGGISEYSQMLEILQMGNVVAIAVGNFLNYGEHTLQKFKLSMTGVPLRPSIFNSKHSSFYND